MYSTLINAPAGGIHAFYAARYVRLGEVFRHQKNQSSTRARLKDLGDLVFYRPLQGAVDVTALICGDPQSGRSALDKKREDERFLKDEATRCFNL